MSEASRAQRLSAHALRAIALCIAATALTWGALGVTSRAGQVMACVGVLGGLVAGHYAGRSRLRGPAIVLLAGATLGLFTALAWTVVGTTGIARALGPANALVAGAALRYFAVALAVTGALRALAMRHRAASALELAAAPAALAAMLAAHRDGIIARPLWLSDWAWQQGHDPTRALLVIGGVAVGLLVVLAALDSRQRLSTSSWLALPLMGLLVLLAMRMVEPPKPDVPDDLGLLSPGEGEQQRAARPEQRSGGGQGGDQPMDLSERLAQGGGLRPADGRQGSGAGQRLGPDGKPLPADQQLERDDPGSQGKAAPVAVVILGDDYSPPSGAFYFRQDAWSHYNGFRLVPPPAGFEDPDRVAQFPTRRLEVPGPPTAPDGEPLGRARVRGQVALIVPHARPFALEAPVAFAPAPTPRGSQFVRAYTFESLAQTRDYRDLRGLGAGDPGWTDDLRELYTTAPTDARYGELARQIVAALPAHVAGDPFVQALAIKLWLDENATYSTRHRHAGVDDPTADFLFGDLTGYCVHFAHAAVYMWRSLGIPARVGVGYHLEEDKRQGSTLVVSGGDAHAWPELYLEGQGWVVLDVAPANNLDPPGEPPDPELARRLGEMARDLPPPPPEPEPPNPGPHPLRVAGVLALALLIMAYAWKAWRRLAPLVATGPALSRVGYRLALDLLAESAWTRGYGETRERFARRVAPHSPTFAELTHLHLAARFGDPGRAAGGDPNAWRQGLGRLRRELRASARWWRRLLGLLNPFSFLASR